MDSLAKQVFRFGSDVVDGNGSMEKTLGGKGAGLAEMMKLSFPVPPGFTVTTDVCRFFLEQGSLPPHLAPELAGSLQWLEDNVGKRFGDARDPLLVSVRSGAPISMPGMMDTILNVGLNDRTVRGLAKKSGSLRFALDSYRRLLQMFGSVVLDVPKTAFDCLLHQIRNQSRVHIDSELDEAALEQLVTGFKVVIEDHTGKPFPVDCHQQLDLAIAAVFRSWNNERARHYRRIHHLNEQAGT